MLSQKQECIDASLSMISGILKLFAGVPPNEIELLNVPPICFCIEHTGRKLERMADNGVE